VIFQQLGRDVYPYILTVSKLYTFSSCLNAINHEAPSALRSRLVGIEKIRRSFFKEAQTAPVKAPSPKGEQCFN
jgi:hypothetical protein